MAGQLRVHLYGGYESWFVDSLKDMLDREIGISHGDDLPADGICHVLVAGRPPREFLETDPGVLIIPWAGLPESTASLLRDRPGIRVFNLHHNAGAAAEMAVALMLSAAKRIIPGHNGLLRGDWTIRYTPSSSMLIEGARVLILGWGSIGRRVAAAVSALGASVRGVRRRISGKDSASGIHPPEELHRLLPDTDILVVCLPLTPSTCDMIGDAELTLLPDHAVIVNVARGAVINEAALFDHLRRGSVGAAGLDVWYSYPDSEEARSSTRPSRFPFHELDNVVMSPHRGGAFGVRELELKRAEALAESLNALARGEDPPHRVDLSEGY